MKLTRKEFTNAQDKQLATLGIQRAKNAGWLKQALAREFTADQVQMFHSARRKVKVKTEAKVATSNAINYGRPHIAGVGTMAICDRFIAGENVADLAEDYGMQRKHIEEAIRFELSRLVKTEGRTIDDFISRLSLADEVEASLQPKPPQDLRSMSEGLMEALVEKHAPKSDSPETYANHLFESTGRDLAQ